MLPATVPAWNTPYLEMARSPLIRCYRPMAVNSSTRANPLPCRWPRPLPACLPISPPMRYSPTPPMRYWISKPCPAPPPCWRAPSPFPPRPGITTSPSKCAT
tara:strand:+ start:85415 stop:85720 length:306 start_codon:yes stop_codon:yes gene_type:complete